MDGIEVVQMMQDYIKKHFQEAEFTIDKVCAAVGYSRRQGDRLFKQYIGKTMGEYINAVCLTQSVYELTETENRVLDIALNSHFRSHEGFTRSFYKRFHITPAEYRENQIPLPLFTQYPISHYQILLKNKEEKVMSNDIRLCMITAKERPRRKLIYLPSNNAQEYISYCEEMGCDWEGLLNSILEKYDTAALIELPEFLIKEGFSKVASGIEVPLDFNKPLPNQYKIAELEECLMLYFQSEPYEKEEDFCQAIESAYAAINKYDPSLYGYKLAYGLAPSFNFGADKNTGARLAIPVVYK